MIKMLLESKLCGVTPLPIELDKAKHRVPQKITLKTVPSLDVLSYFISSQNDHPGNMPRVLVDVVNGDFLVDQKLDGSEMIPEPILKVVVEPTLAELTDYVNGLGSTRIHVERPVYYNLDTERFERAN